jgi:hypothetical protein
MPDQHDHDLALSQFWNELTERGDSSRTIDPEAAELIRSLRIAASAPVPGSTRERVWRGLLDIYERTVPDKEPPMHASVDVIRPGPNGRIRPLHPIPFEERPRLANRRLALGIAAILVIALVGGIVGGLIQDRLDSNDPRPAPAILAPATPEPTGDTVLEITLPADAIPADGFDTGGLGVFVISPGSRSTWERTCCAGPLIEHVVAGAYTVRAQEPIEIIWASGTTETVAAGTGVTLGPGDSLVSRNEVVVEAANEGSEPVVLVNFVMVEDPGGQFNGHQLSGARAEGNHVKEPIALRPEETTLRLSQTTAVAGETIPAIEHGYQFVVTTTDDAFTTQISDGSAELFGPEGEPIDVYLLTLIQDQPASNAPDTQSPVSPDVPDTGDGTLVEVTLPADVVPAGELATVALLRDTIPANSTSEWDETSGSCCPGAKVYVVLAGTVRLVADGPAKVVTGGGSGAPEEIAAGTEISLKAGDAVMVRHEQGAKWTTGDDPVDVLTAAVVAGSPPGSANPSTWEGHGFALEDHSVEMPGGPYTLRVQQVSLDPNDVLPVPESGIVQLGVGQNDESLGVDSSGGISAPGATEPTTVYVLVLEIAAESSATPAP